MKLLKFPVNILRLLQSFYLFQSNAPARQNRDAIDSPMQIHWNEPHAQTIFSNHPLTKFALRFQQMGVHDLRLTSSLKMVLDPDV